MNTKIFAILMVFLLASCGGGSEGSSENPSSSFSSKVSSSISSIFSSVSSAVSSSSSSSGETINGHVVPPEPDEKLNNSTIEGIDSDSNGIRDDIDREIARKFGSTSSEFKLAQKHYSLLQDIMVNRTEELMKEYNSNSNCLNGDLLMSFSEVTKESFLNTPERTIEYAKTFSDYLWEIGECENELQ